jgi:REP element-mobilizing transposase RayT
MPCYLFTWHAYGTWMPDRPQGYVKSKQILAPNAIEAAKYRARQNEPSASFDSDVQEIMIDELGVTAEHRRFRLHSVATDPTHLHALMSWSDERSVKELRRGIRESITRRLNKHQRRTWFVHRGSRKRVSDREHFDHLMKTYLPKHRGWKWDEWRGKYR